MTPRHKTAHSDQLAVRQEVKSSLEKRLVVLNCDITRYLNDIVDCKDPQTLSKLRRKWLVLHRHRATLLQLQEQELKK